MTRARATATGLSAILIWSTLVLLLVHTAPMPPFLLIALCMTLGGAVGLAWAAGTGRLGLLAAVPLRAHAFGTVGLFGEQALFVTAMRTAPVAEAQLVNGLWPLLLVLLSGCLPGEALRVRHVGGAAMAFAGVALVVAGPAEGIEAAALPGLGLAFLAALAWAGYSVGSRALGAVPSEAVAVSCLGAGALAAVAHLLFEEAAWPPGAGGWIALALIGAGPTGLAFILWDVGMKRGDIQLLGVASNMIPLLTAGLLVLAGEAEPSMALASGALLVAAGAALATGAGRRPSDPGGGPWPKAAAPGQGPAIRAPVPSSGYLEAGAPPERPAGPHQGREPRRTAERA